MSNSSGFLCPHGLDKCPICAVHNKLISEGYAVESPFKGSEQRKAEPIYSGVLRYFPDALAAVSRVSKAGNDKHNPGQPLHWSRGKSNDHLDCVTRHILTPGVIDSESGELHLAHAAWRVLAALQLAEEQRVGARYE